MEKPFDEVDLTLIFHWNKLDNIVSVSPHKSGKLRQLTANEWINFFFIREDLPWMDTNNISAIVNSISRLLALG